MADPEIERGVPVPPVERPTTGAKGKYGPLRRTLHKLNIGQSFVFYKTEFYAVRGAIAREQREFPTKQFTIRQIHADGRYRVWRIKKER